MRYACACSRSVLLLFALWKLGDSLRVLDGSIGVFLQQKGEKASTCSTALVGM